jgi:hypothetical protein
MLPEKIASDDPIVVKITNRNKNTTTSFHRHGDIVCRSSALLTFEKGYAHCDVDGC